MNYYQEFATLDHRKRFSGERILDIYATSVDYDPKSAITQEFFKTVQNKMHWAAHGHTAAEIIIERADGDKDFMGLTTFSGDLPKMGDALVAKII